MLLLPWLLVLICYIKNNQSFNNHKCCLFLEMRLKPGCMFCISKHNTKVCINSEWVLGEVQCWAAKYAPIQPFWSGWELRVVSASSVFFTSILFSVGVLALTCFPSYFAQFWSSISQTLIKMLRFVAIFCQVMVFCYLPFFPLLISDSHLSRYLLYFLSPSINGRMSGRK